MSYTDDEHEAIRQYALNPSARETMRAIGREWREGLISPYFQQFPNPGDDLRLRLPPDLRNFGAFGVLSRGAPIFAVGQSTLAEVTASAGPCEAIALPPLPFPEIVVECTGGRLAFMQPDGSDRFFVIAQLIRELERGQSWGVTTIGRQTRTTAPLWDSFVTPEGTVRRTSDGGMTPMGPHDALDRVAIEAVHLITARGVDHHKISRQQRRSFERSYGQPHPQAWRITLGESGSGTHDTASGRRYTCRWFVRGHWARLPDGARPSGVVPWRDDDGLEVWRDPYLKGPAGLRLRNPEHPVRDAS